MLPGKKYKPEDILRIAWRRKWIIVVPFVACALGTAAYSWRLPNRYQSDTLIMVVPQRVPESYVKATVTSRIEDRLQSISQLILSRNRLEKVITDFNLYPEARRSGIMEDIVQTMRTRDIRVDVVKGDAFRVSFTYDNPKTAMDVANRLATAFMDESSNDRQIQAESTTSFLATQLEDAKRRLEESEKKLAEYQTAHAGELPSERESNVQAMSAANMQVAQLVESINRDRDRRYLLEKALADLNAETPATTNASISPDDPTGVTGGSTSAQLQVALETLRGMETRLKPDHPDVNRMKKLVRDLQNKLQQEALQRPVSGGANDRPATPEEATRRARIKGLQLEIESIDLQIANKQEQEKRIRAQIGTYQARLGATPTRESELTGLTRDYDTLYKNYQSLLTKQEDSKIASNLESRMIGEQFRTLDQARLPEKPVSPNRPLINMIGALVGLGIGVGLVGLLEYKDNSFRTDEEVVSLLSLPVIAVIPLMTSAAERNRARRRTVIATVAGVVFLVAAAGAAAWLMFFRT